jgi:hypothetical protein
MEEYIKNLKEHFGENRMTIFWVKNQISDII